MAAPPPPRLRHGRDGFNNGVRRGGRPEDVPVRRGLPAGKNIGQDDVGGRRPTDEISARSDLEPRLACEGRQRLLLLEGPRDVASQKGVDVDALVEIDQVLVNIHTAVERAVEAAAHAPGAVDGLQPRDGGVASALACGERREEPRSQLHGEAAPHASLDRRRGEGRVEEPHAAPRRPII